MTYREIMNTFLFSLLFLGGCSSSIEIQKIDELRVELNTVDSILNIDMNIFMQRKEMIKKDMSFLKANLKEVSLEVGTQMDKYKNIRKIYEKQSAKHADLVKLHSDLSTQLNNLETDVKNYKVSKDKFKAYYRTEREDVEQLSRDAKAVKKALYEVEPEFQRLNKIVQQMLLDLSNED